MARKPQYSKEDLCRKAGFTVEKKIVYAYGKEYPLVEPVSIHLHAYRTHISHQTRYDAMYAAFAMLWPKQVPTYNYWMERIFWEHCNHETEFISLAAGGGIGKTHTAGYVGSIFWLSNPRQNTVVVTSTTLNALLGKILGYTLTSLRSISISSPFKFKTSPPPCIVPIPDPDFKHGIFGVAVKQGTDQEAIKEIIGRHPIHSFLLILDEAPYMPVGVLGALSNLKKALQGRFQAIGIGNPLGTDDLHGIISTPKNGWDSVNINTPRWETTQPKGVCLYFNPYDSPAIHEQDPEKKKLLSKLLPTAEKLAEAERDEGKESDEFYRMTLGFWRNVSTNKTIVSEAFLKDYDPTKPAEFSGKHPLAIVAGLDPAFSVGGDKCILRLAVLGHHVNGKMVLDYRGPQFVFNIPILARTGKSAELQIADQVIEICKKYGVPLNTLCVDASGAGRALADVLQLRSNGSLTPTKIFSTNISKKHGKDITRLDEVISSAHEMWFKGREFISHQQVHGLDPLAYGQLHTRLVIEKGGKKELENKYDYRQRMSKISGVFGRSPDEADAAMLCLQSAILHYGFYPGQTKEMTRYKDNDSMRFDIAKREYQKGLEQSKPFILKGTYTNGLASILKKKAF